MSERIEIELPEDKLSDLLARLNRVNWPPVVGLDSWAYGVPQEWLKSMVDYWSDHWDWSTQAEAMNQWAHYRTTIDGVPIHYLHAPAEVDDAPGLILTHGWPWTFWDFKEVIGPLSRPSEYGGSSDQAFNVVVPSLPGFGFSTPLVRAGVDVAAIADMWVKLMTEELGYTRFAAHGGDWGALITAQLAHAHAEHLIGAHLGLAVIPGVNRQGVADEYTEEEQWMVARNAESVDTITSHVAVHRLDPQTLAYGLADSPLGTAAWIWERRRNWSDCDGDVERAFDRDHLCTTASIYWCTGSITSSLRLYFEHFGKPWPLVHERHPVLEAPSAIAVFPKDVVHTPRSVIEREANLKRYTVMPRGGHFGAAEAPELLVDELREFFHVDLA